MEARTRQEDEQTWAEWDAAQKQQQPQQQNVVVNDNNKADDQQGLVQVHLNLSN